MNRTESIDCKVKEIKSPSVTNLRQRFESFKDNEQDQKRPNFPVITKDVSISKVKPQPPKKNYLIRKETMRVSALIENRNGLVVQNFPLSPITISPSISDRRPSSDSSESLYENVPQITVNEE